MFGCLSTRIMPKTIQLLGMGIPIFRHSSSLLGAGSLTDRPKKTYTIPRPRVMCRALHSVSKVKFLQNSHT